MSSSSSRYARALARPLSLLALASAPLAAQQREFAQTTTLQLPEEQRLRGVLAGDIDGDGRSDLVLLAVQKGDSFVRALRIYLRRDETAPFRGTPDQEIEVPEDAVAWACGDVHADPGEELLLFTATGAYALRWKASEAERFVPLFACDFLWQLPQPRRLHLWQRGLVDLDRDGDLDLWVPEPEGFRLAFQDRDASGVHFHRGARLDLPIEARAVKKQGKVRSMRVGGRVQFRLDSSIFGISPLLDLKTALPTPSFVDFDGDQDLDVVAQTERHVHVWVQEVQGWRAQEESAVVPPTLRFDAPVPMDDERRTDWFYSTRVRDLDQDGRADAVVIYGDQKAEDFRSLAQVFVNGRGNGAAAKTAEAPLFGPKGYPDQLLAINGYLVNPRFEDVDGDKHDDFALLSLRFDFSDAMRASGSLDVDLFLFRGKGGTFSKEPDLAHRLTVKGETMRGGGAQMELRFCGDLTGDGVRELLVRDRSEHLAIYWVRSRRGALEVLPQALWEMKLDEDAELLLLDRTGQRQELAILEEGQLLHVRFP
ncbi:MAG: VCBS repeat-containing protein [Planctomycetes bacterium]|nr:VCBS repeat-containing protein [Planctomycetota bacterium]